MADANIRETTLKSAKLSILLSLPGLFTFLLSLSLGLIHCWRLQHNPLAGRAYHSNELFIGTHEAKFVESSCHAFARS
jgi:hypothetical protein